MPEQVPLRALIRLSVALAAVSFVFVAIYAFTQHAPEAHGLRIAFVGSSLARIHSQTGLDGVSPGAFELHAYPNAASARKAVLEREVYGAYIQGNGSTSTILTATAAGSSAQQAIEHAFGEMVAHAPVGMGRVKLVTIDLKPLPANDSRGLSSSALQFGLLLPSFVFGILLFIFGRRTVLAQRLLAIAVFVLGAALVAALTVGPLIGAFSGHFWAILAVGALFTAAAVLITYGLESLLGFAGTGLAAFILVLIGNATAGGASNQEFLPNGFRQIGQALPNGAFVRFIRNTVYFDGNHTGVALLVIALWALGGLALVLAADPLRARLGRSAAAPGAANASS
ncbi:MAG: hypothetical protein ABSB96_09745 [Gaiellaceae bacterium]